MSRIFRSFAIVAAALLVSGQSYDWPQMAESFDQSGVIIETRASGCFRFQVHLAVNRTQQARGLMHVREMPQRSGMLFVYERDGLRSMWMKNTYIPLDILFIRRDGTVANVAENTEPLSLNSISAIEPVRYALELNGGVATALGIDSESRIFIDAPL